MNNFTGTNAVVRFKQIITLFFFKVNVVVCISSSPFDVTVCMSDTLQDIHLFVFLVSTRTFASFFFYFWPANYSERPYLLSRECLALMMSDENKKEFFFFGEETITKTTRNEF